MTVVQIVKKYLEENNYDGLCNPTGECGCDLNDLVPCWGICDDCEPAYKIPKSKMTEDEKEFAEYEGLDFIYRSAEEEKE
ncbi:MAG: hypothetical protein ACOC56_06415 [Atribacterota bacterium]